MSMGDLRKTNSRAGKLWKEKEESSILQPMGSWFSEEKDHCNYNSDFWNKEFIPGGSLTVAINISVLQGK